MHTLAQHSPALPERLTWKEICERCPNQHVYLVEVEEDEWAEIDVLSARVIGHGVTHGEALAQAMPLRDFYTFTYRHTGSCNESFHRPFVPVTVHDEAQDALSPERRADRRASRRQGTTRN